MSNPETTKLFVALRLAAEEAYQRDVVDTGMFNHIIGANLEYADKADWLECKIENWLTAAKMYD